jgi:hypothetical protein
LSCYVSRILYLSFYREVAIMYLGYALPHTSGDSLISTRG